MEERVLNLYKEVGETPLERIDRFRGEHPEYGDVKMSYAGRLDPMAEGVLLVLVGEENKNREKYIGLEKAYSFEVLLGVETDTYDILGLIESVSPDTSVTEEEVRGHLQSFSREFEQKFPPYSSKPILGKPSFVHARKGEDEIEQPAKTVFVQSIELRRLYTLSGEEVLQTVRQRVEKVRGDFRQEQVLTDWRMEMKKYGARVFTVAVIDIVSSSGTYVRSIAHEWGKNMGVGAIAYSIVRTRVGDYEITHSIR